MIELRRKTSKRLQSSQVNIYIFNIFFISKTSCHILFCFIVKGKMVLSFTNNSGRRALLTSKPTWFTPVKSIATTLQKKKLRSENSPKGAYLTYIFPEDHLDWLSLEHHPMQESQIIVTMFILKFIFTSLDAHVNFPDLP